MNVTTLAKTIHTFKDWELEQLFRMLEPDADANGGASRSKCKLIRTEQSRRRKLRNENRYKDETLPSELSIPKRLEKLGKSF